MKRHLVSFAAMLALGAASAAAAPINVAVDIDSTRLSGSDTSGVLVTQPGFVSWELTSPATAGNLLVEQGVTFEVFGLAAANQSRLRATGDGSGNDNLLRDFVFNDGATRAVGLRITGLEVGTYAMQSWHFDSGVTGANLMQIEVRNQGEPSPPDPVVDAFAFSPAAVAFQFQVTAPGEVKEIVFREDGDTNRARLNAFTLATVPEPSSLGLLSVAALLVGVARRQK